MFRNETLDATHLAEFQQIEGWVADKGLGLGHLKGIIAEFFHKIGRFCLATREICENFFALGMKDLKFKPTYNPYTEPSMEIYAFHPLLNRWVEIGNSGIFRPEMLIPMGIPSDINIIAWGLSLERPTMIQYGYSNIRDLVGYKVNLKTIRENPVCCLVDKTQKTITTLL